MSAPGWTQRLERAFSVYDVDPADEAHAYFSSQDPKVLEGMFDAVREEVARDDCFPLLLRRKDDYAFYILRNRPRSVARPWIAWLLFLATVATTILAGAVFAQGHRGLAEPLLSPGNLAVGALTFALPLLLILGAQAGAHHLVARRFGIDVGAPWLIPLPPPLSFMGTLGAVTNVRTPIATRRHLALFAAAGPLAAFAVSLLLVAVGSLLPAPAPPAGAEAIDVGAPLAMEGLTRLLGADTAALHPLTLAGWVGLFLTALHLLPAAGLAGGMLARALLAREAKWVALATIVALGAMGILFWWPWLLVAVGLALAGVVHPQPLNEVTPPGRLAWALGIACAVALLLSFALVPLA